MLLDAIWSVPAVFGSVGPGEFDPSETADNSDWVLLFVYLGIALGFSFLCSVAEAVLLSITPSYAATLRVKNPKFADVVDRLKANVERPLAAILSLNTIAHTVGAAGVGAQAQIVFEGKYVGLTSAVLTLLILVLSEIIPKTIGAVYWRGLAPVVARLVNWLIYLMYPLVVLSEWLAKLLSPSEAHPTITRAEVAAMAAQGAAEGHLDEGESRVLHNLFRLKVLTGRDIMTPRTVMVCFPQDMTVGEFATKHPDVLFSRLPIYEGTRDGITGFVLKTDLLLARARGEEDRPLKEFRRDMLTVSSKIPLSTLFERFTEERSHIALLVDEFGGSAGLATLEDVVETLLGFEIMDEADRTEDMRVLARQQWESRAKRLGLLGETGEAAAGTTPETSAETAAAPS